MTKRPLSIQLVIEILLLILLGYDKAICSNIRGIPEVGVILGEPTGVTIKLQQEKYFAIDLAAGLSDWNGRLHLHADFLIQRSFRSNNQHSFFPYLGIGIWGKASPGKTGIRFPIGLSYIHEVAGQPLALDFFLESAPTIDLSPNRSFRWETAIGIRMFLLGV